MLQATNPNSRLVFALSLQYRCPHSHFWLVVDESRRPTQIGPTFTFFLLASSCITGWVGERGPTGAAGSPGAQGQQGDAGTDGTPGVDGAIGQNGINGAPGDKGLKGPQGTNGYVCA
jgi:hypothetical protein